MLELMARGGMRVSEVLKLIPKDVDSRKLILRDPKSGNETEVVFIPQKVADRLKGYCEQKGIGPDQRIFPLTYQGARAVVNKAGKLVGIHLRTHDLRRHVATHASRSGTPIEIVSKVILRHANLSTTQRYLGKVSDTEALRWIENLYDEIKTHQCATLRGQMPTIIRSKRADLVEQELYAMLIMYNLIRVLIYESANKEGKYPLQISFLDTLQLTIDSAPFMTTAKDSKRKQMFNYLLDMIANSPIDRPRRLRSNPRVVKVKMSKFKRKRKKDRSEYRNFEEDTQIITQLAA